MRTLQSEIRRLRLLQQETDKKKPIDREEKRYSERRETSERLSTRDIEELMGVRRPRYKRHNGAIKQR